MEGVCKIALEESTAKAWRYWRGIRRAQLENGWDEAELYGDYYAAVRRYQARHMHACETSAVVRIEAPMKMEEST